MTTLPIDVRHEWRKIVEIAEKHLTLNMGNANDVLTVYMNSYVSILEKRIAEIMMERQFYWTKELTQQEINRVINYELSKELEDEQ